MTGYSGTPLVKKLGIKPGYTVQVINAPAQYLRMLSPLPAEVKYTEVVSGKADLIHLFVNDLESLKRTFTKSKAALKPAGSLWISWPKKASKVTTDLDENVIRHYGLEHGLVDVKVCSVTEVWSGLKFVFRLKDRPTG